jgi:hypothetical protein
MSRATLLLAIGFCGALAGCGDDPPLEDYALDGITVLVGFDEPICGGTFDWIEARLRWLVAETGLPKSEAPIRYYWTREETDDRCPPVSGGCTVGNRIYSPLEVLSHEMVHGHLARLGSPRPWITEGMARMLEDTRWDLDDRITLPSAMIEVSKPRDLDYNTAASFVRYLRDRFGMPALLELYAALDGMRAPILAALVLAACGDAAPPGFSTGPAITSVSASTSGSSSGGDTSSTGRPTTRPAAPAARARGSCATSGP